MISAREEFRKNGETTRDQRRLTSVYYRSVWDDARETLSRSLYSNERALLRFLLLGIRPKILAIFDRVKIITFFGYTRKNIDTDRVFPLSLSLSLCLSPSLANTYSERESVSPLFIKYIVIYIDFETS